MKRFQMFAEAVQGRKLVYLYRPKSKAAENAATTLAFTTQNERTSQKSANSTSTKDGSIRTPGTDSTEITSTSILAKGDDTLPALEDAYDNDELIQVWEVNLDEPGTKENTFKAIYMEGYITEFKYTSKAEDYAEVAMTVGVSGAKAKGEATMTQEQREQAALVFTDTVKQSAAPSDTGGKSDTGDKS